MTTDPNCFNHLPKWNKGATAVAIVPAGESFYRAIVFTAPKPVQALGFQVQMQEMRCGAVSEDISEAYNYYTVWANASSSRGIDGYKVWSTTYWCGSSSVRRIGKSTQRWKAPRSSDSQFSERNRFREREAQCRISCKMVPIFWQILRSQREIQK